MKMKLNNYSKMFTIIVLMALTFTSWGEYWHFHKSKSLIICDSCKEFSNQYDISFTNTLYEDKDDNCSLCKVIRSFENNYINSDNLCFNIEKNHFFEVLIKIVFFDIEIYSLLNKSPPFIS
jgi:hypothetical protein